MNRVHRAIAALLLHMTIASALAAAGLSTALAQQAQPDGSQHYTMQEMVDAGHNYFGSATDGFARVVENAFQQYGLPNGYVLGEEASGALVGGLTYGEGQLYTKNAGEHPVFWQGPSLGFDYGGQGSRVMMLVYELGSVDDIYGRFAGVSGQAYAVAGAGMTVLQGAHVVIVPIRTGVGARIGINIGYLKLTRRPTWNPF
ncbi:DUF1134 domain-containing protein [Hoeflea prorocentri]|uniref:EipA family protein n=1 Tax=Hoeflea prorocentri TaxID=1922333 RepID=A0A9X3ZG09_9HYPH|nr:EipA family protein [Hoeflea prorocentri]MCY6379335.1 EipA family protein [Hoeflea prorocentri]MDA5397136.1 EipA family protein [Hoeflea prorocentri]